MVGIIISPSRTDHFYSSNITIYDNTAESRQDSSLAQFLDRPLLLAERTAVVLFDPETHAALVETVVTVPPHPHAVLPTTSVQLGLRLAPLVSN